MAIKNFPPVNRVISTTTNYGMFKRVEGNRSVDPRRVNKIKNSILENGYICCPITVNEKMEVIDGQGRLQVLSELGIPVDYIVVPGTGVKECTAMNIASTNWKQDDYILSHAETGNENYQRLLQLVKEFPNVQKSVVLSAVCGKPMRGNAKEVNDGSLILGEREWSRAYPRLEFVASCAPAFKSAANRYTLQYALLKCCDIPGLDRERLRTRLLETRDLSGYANLEDCYDVLSDIYNYRLRPNSKIDIKHYFKYEATK